MAFVRKHTLDRFFLIDALNVSVRDNIAKELISNVLVHREYSSPMPGRIIIEKDRIVTENWNRPLHPGRIDPESFEAYPKNPILARFFVQIGYADTLGSGVRNLYKFTKMYSGSVPELIEGDVFKTIVPLGTSVTHGVTETVTENVTEMVTENVTEREAKILALLKQNKEMTQADMAAQLSVSRKTIALRLKSLKGKGLIKRVGSDTKGHWDIVDED
jgi:ATP-dependent DNA helicase RecG